MTATDFNFNIDIAGTLNEFVTSVKTDFTNFINMLGEISFPDIKETFVPTNFFLEGYESLPNVDSNFTLPDNIEFGSLAHQSMTDGFIRAEQDVANNNLASA